MDKTGPIIIIEDDYDDKMLLEEIFKNLNYVNEIIFFGDGDRVLEYLNNFPDVKPFLILSDINLPKINGFALRDKIYTDEKLRLRCIPYLFFTTSASQHSVIEAYSKSVQGFFVKPNDYNVLEGTIKSIVEYWQRCTSPNYIP